MAEDDEPLTVAELHEQVRYLREHLVERLDMSPRERGQVVGARDMAAVIDRMICRVQCTCGTE